MNTKHLTRTAILAVLLTVAEFILSPLPNIQITVLLIAIITINEKTSVAILSIFTYVVLDNLLWGGFSLYTVPMFAGWVLVFLTFKTPGHNHYLLASKGVIASILYNFPYSMLFPFKAYWASSITFVIVMSISSFVTILWLYEPIKRRVYEGT